MQIFGIDHTSSHILAFISTYLANNSPKRWFREIEIYLLYGFHRSLHVIPQGVALMPQGECRVNMAQKKNAYTIFGPRIARNEAPFSVLC